MAQIRRHGLPQSFTFPKLLARFVPAEWLEDPADNYMACYIGPAAYYAARQHYLMARGYPEYDAHDIAMDGALGKYYDHTAPSWNRPAGSPHSKFRPEVREFLASRRDLDQVAELNTSEPTLTS